MTADLAGLRAGLLHTVPALAGTFQASITAARPGIELIHLADPWLLDTAVSTGITVEVGDRVSGHIGYLISAGAQAVLVTCSSIGEAVEAAAAAAPVPVLRVDAPMAAEAVALAVAAALTAARQGSSRAGRIAVLATLQATLGPTGRLIQRAADASSADVLVTSSVVEGAVAARQAGDQAAHDRLISAAVEEAAGSSDVVVLAQASMAQATSGLTLGVPVLTSPRSGTEAFLAALAAAVPGVDSARNGRVSG